MVLTDKPSVYLNFVNDSDKIQLTNPVSLGESWTVEAWFSLSPIARQNLRQNLLEQKLQANDPQQDVHFGNSVAISGNFAIIGANLEDTGSDYAGSAYIFERDNDGTWIEKQKLLASDAEAGDLFGTSVAISDNCAIIGANLEDTKGNYAGSAYIFERDNDGTWIEKQKLFASDAEAGDLFGTSVAISENFAIIGANLEDTKGSNAGSAYIFERDNDGTWTETQKLLASDTEAGDNFGNSVALNGNFALVGANGESTGGSNAGSVYIFERDNDDTWTETQKLLASDAEAGDLFGVSLAINDNFALVGANGESTGGSNAGSAYIFERDSSGSWAEKQKLLASDAEAKDCFGYSVAISDNFAFVGAYRQDVGDSNLNAGSAYIFERDSSGSWIEKQKILASDSEAEDYFGNAVAINDNFALVGANGEDAIANNAGSAYIFTLSLPEPSRVLVASSNGDTPVVIQDESKLGTVIEGVFYDSGYDLAQLTPGWHHLAAVGKDTNTQFYLDGQKIADVKQALIDAALDDASKQEIEAKICQVTGDISSIGNVINGFKQFGQLAELRIWNLARSDQEIANNSSIGLRGNEPGLAAYYPLNEAEGNQVKSLTDSNNNATVTDATWEIDNKVIDPTDQAMKFAGQDDYVELPVINIDFSQGLTVEAWVYYEAFANYSRIIDFGNGAGTDNIIFCNQSNTNSLGFHVYQGDKKQYIVIEDLLEAGKWIHIAATIDSSENAKLFKDGEEVKSGSVHLPSNIERTLNYLGKSNWSGDSYFEGSLAEIRVWNKACTAEEIKENMHQCLTGDESGLVVYLLFNEIQKEGDTQKVLDLANNQNHGIVHGALLVNNLDLDHQVMQFDGTNDYIEVPYSATINPNQFTVSCWVKVTGGVDRYCSPITCRNNSPNCQGYKFYAGSNNKWQMWIGIGEKWQPVIGTDIVLNTWTHLAGTYDGSKLKFYIDGKLASELETNLVVNTSAPLRIAGGKTESEVDYLLPGQVAEVRIWNQVRTAEEIEWYMHQRLRGNESGLVAYYPLDEIQTEGDTQKVLDYTNNHNHGTVHGGYLVDYLDRQGIEFSDQNDYIEVPAHANPTKAITVSLWAKSNTENWNEYGCLASKRNAYILHPWIDGKTIKFFIYASGWKSVEYTPSDIKQWHHYAGTFDGKILKLYIDGVEVAKENVFSRKTAINSDKGALYIGKDDDLERYFNGQIAEVSIWNKACTAKAIQGYMHRSLKGNESGLVTYLPLNGIQREGDTQKMLDLTTKKNHGIVHGTLQTTLLTSNLEHQGMEFDGAKDYINCGKDINLANKSFTISFWAKRHSISEKTVCIVAQTKKDPPDNNHGLLIGFRGDTNKFFLAFWGNPLDSDASYKDTDWHYWSCTFDHTTKRQAIYRDGILLKERTADSNSLASGDLLLGCFFRNRYYFHGALAEVSIWNHAHTEAQIQGTMNQFLSGKEPGLIAYLPLNKI